MDANHSAEKSESDVLVVRKDQSIDYHQGVLHDVTEDTVRFDLDGESLPVKRSKIFGLAYRHRAVTSLPAAVCRITDAAGSQWSVHSLRLAGKLQWTTPAGLSVAQPPDEIVQIDFSGGKIVYLSDLKPESIRWTPYFSTGKVPAAVEQFYAPRFDRNFESGPLQLGGVQYRKAWRCAAARKSSIACPTRSAAFGPWSGSTTRCARGAKCGWWSAARQSAAGRRHLGRRRAANDRAGLSAVRHLTILVDFGETLSTGDYLLLCNARLCK